MRKHQAKKLKLNRETLRGLHDDRVLAEVGAGASRHTCDTCPEAGSCIWQFCDPGPG